MSHLATRSAYGQLTDRLNLFPQGAPPSALLHGILRLLFSEQEAGLVALLPIKPFTAKTAARIWKKTETDARDILETFAGRGMLLDTEQDGDSVFTLPPPMAGFFEFSLMRVRQDIDQKALSELFYQYLNVEEDFIRALFATGQTQLGRIFVNEDAVPPDLSLSVLDHERASDVIRTATYRAVGVCYCRHKMEHLGRSCDAPMEICLTFNSAAESLIKHGIARSIDATEGLDLLQQAYERNLVQFGENVRREVSFICNCCGCCCEAMLAAKRFGLMHPVHTTNYIPVADEEKCNGCGKCVDVCPVGAMSLVSAGDPQRKRRRKSRLNEEICLGCGVCVRNCSEGGIRLTERSERVVTPVNSVHKVVLMAIERGKLQNLIFDNQAMWNHRAMAAILGVILSLPPLKQVMASRQMKSRYLERILARADGVDEA
jgi:ferredoxin